MKVYTTTFDDIYVQLRLFSNKSGSIYLNKETIRFHIDNKAKIINWGLILNSETLITNNKNFDINKLDNKTYYKAFIYYVIKEILPELERIKQKK